MLETLAGEELGIVADVVTEWQTPTVHVPAIDPSMQRLPSAETGPEKHKLLEHTPALWQASGETHGVPKGCPLQDAAGGTATVVVVVNSWHSP